MLNGQMAAALGQQSSQPGSWQEPKKGDANENLAYYLAMMASSPVAQNPFNVEGGASETPTDLGLSGLGTSQSGLGDSQNYYLDASGGGQGTNIMSDINTTLNTIRTGTQLYGAGSNLYNALFGGNNAQNISDVGSQITNLNLVDDWSSLGSVPSLWDSVSPTDLFDTGFIGW